MGAKNAKRLAPSHRRSSKTAEREIALSAILLLSGEEGGLIARVLRVFGALEGFRLLRRLSGLRIRVPEDLHLIQEFAPKDKMQELTVGTDSRLLCFPSFFDLFKVQEQVRCYFIQKKYGTKIAAHSMGWSEKKVRRVCSEVSRRAECVERIV